MIHDDSIEASQILHQYSISRRLQKLKFLLAVLLSGFGIAIIAAYLNLPRSGEGCECQNTQQNTLGLGCIGVLVLIVGILTFYWWYRRQGLTVNIGSTGLEIMTRNRVSIIAWDDIADIDYSGRRNRDLSGYEIRLTLKTGQRTRLSGEIQKATELYGLLMKNWINAIYPPLKKRFDQGETLTFGLISLNKSGVFIDDEYQAWDDFGVMFVSQRDVTLTPILAKLILDELIERKLAESDEQPTVVVRVTKNGTTRF